ncbi:MAG TPA: PspA/IM30 family protein [Polyangiaceae bacterium]|nr:PspA/IM30 family protein [Polyangiaceae bacterium]
MTRAFPRGRPPTLVNASGTWQIPARMGIFDRMGRVISSNFNGLLDRLEDPGKSVESLLENMRDQLRAARQEVVRAVAAEKQLREKVKTLDAEAEKWNQRAELALKRGDESLAREALLQKQRVVGERDRAEALASEQLAAAHEMKNELPRMEQKIQEFSLRKSTIATQAQMAKHGSGVESLGRTGGASPGPFEEMRRIEDQIEGVEASIQAQRELDQALGTRGPSGLSRAELEAKFRNLEANEPGPSGTPEIEAELKALKQKIRIKE